MSSTTIPKGFFPLEDIGQLQVSTLAREDISFDAMKVLQAKVADVFAKSPYVAHVGSSVGSAGGLGAMNSGRLFVELKPKSERPPLQKVLSDLRRQLGVIAGISTFMNPVQNLSVGARASASQYQFVVQSLNQDLMNQWAQKLTDAMACRSGLFHRCQLRSAEQRRAGAAGHRSRQGGFARHHSRCPALDALWRLRRRSRCRRSIRRATATR